MASDFTESKLGVRVSQLSGGSVSCPFAPRKFSNKYNDRSLIFIVGRPGSLLKWMLLSCYLGSTNHDVIVLEDLDDIRHPSQNKINAATAGVLSGGLQCQFESEQNWDIIFASNELTGQVQVGEGCKYHRSILYLAMPKLDCYLKGSPYLRLIESYLAFVIDKARANEVVVFNSFDGEFGGKIDVSLHPKSNALSEADLGRDFKPRIETIDLNDPFFSQDLQQLLYDVQRGRVTDDRLNLYEECFAKIAKEPFIFSKVDT